MKYSIIVPVYNAKKYLNKCVDSLLNGAGEDAEIILINDGSTDNSGEICQAYKDKFAQIVYIDKENGGVSSARNAGISVAKGKYIMFVDSDDYVDRDFYSILNSVTNEYDYDFVRFSYQCVNGSWKRDKISKDLYAIKYSAATKALAREIYKQTINPPWAKLYKREILDEHEIRFPLGHNLGEDKIFNLEYALYVNSFKTDSRIAYCFNTENEGSLSRKVPDPKYNHSTDFSEYIDNMLASANINVKRKKSFGQASNFCKVRRIYTVAKRLHRQGLEKRQRHIELLKLCKSNNTHRLRLPANIYCQVLALPARLRMLTLIDWVACILNGGLRRNKK